MPKFAFNHVRTQAALLLALIPAMALASCGSAAKDDLTEKLARAEAAALRAEKAQHAAESALARARSNYAAPVGDEEPVVPPAANDEPAPAQAVSQPQAQTDGASTTPIAHSAPPA